MKQNKSKVLKILGWLLLLIAIGLFGLQMGFLIFSDFYQVEYIDDRLFYLINISWIISLYLAFVILIKWTKVKILIGSAVVILFLALQTVLLVQGQKEVKNITSISPDFKQVFSIKEDAKDGKAMYYRSYYHILARPKGRLSNVMEGECHIKWLADDVAAFTYETKHNGIQQFIGTYGDRGSGRSYYNVGPELHGEWKGDHHNVISGPDGIQVIENETIDSFAWEDIEQFGTLAIVLKKDGEAVWTIALAEDFEVRADATKETKGSIRLYKATIGNENAVTLTYSSPHDQWKK